MKKYIENVLVAFFLLVLFTFFGFLVLFSSHCYPLSSISSGWDILGLIFISAIIGAITLLLFS